MTRTSTRLLDPLQLDETDHQAWVRLAGSAATSNAFLDPSFVIPAVRHLPDASGVRLVVTGTSEARWDAAALVVPGARWRHLPLPALGTWSHGQQGLATPLLNADNPDQAADHLVAALTEIAPRATLFGLDEHCAEETAGTALSAALTSAGWRSTVWRSHERAVWVRGQSSQPVPAESARLRTKRRRLERDLGPIEVRDCSEPDQADFGSAMLLRLETQGWKGQAGTAMSQRPGEAGMLLDVARAGARQGTLRSTLLVCGEVVVAAQLDLVSGDTWFHWKTAYDPEYAASSPGRLLLTHVLERFDREGLRCWDACTVPGHPVMDALLPHRRTIIELAATRGRAATAVVRAGREARRLRDGTQ